MFLITTPHSVSEHENQSLVLRRVNRAVCHMTCSALRTNRQNNIEIISNGQHANRGASRRFDDIFYLPKFIDGRNCCSKSTIGKNMVDQCPLSAQ